MIASVKTNCTIQTYPEEGSGVTDEYVEVTSHWNDDRRVHLRIGDKEVIVVGKDIITAVSNCMMTG